MSKLEKGNSDETEDEQYCLPAGLGFFFFLHFILVNNLWGAGGLTADGHLRWKEIDVLNH